MGLSFHPVLGMCQDGIKIGDNIGMGNKKFNFYEVFIRTLCSTVNLSNDCVERKEDIEFVYNPGSNSLFVPYDIIFPNVLVL